MTSDPILLTPDEARWALRLSRSKFFQLVADGELKRIKIGRAARYRRADVEEFVARMAGDESSDGAGDAA